jgi:hypothetical protein
MAEPTVPPRSDAVQLAELLDSPEITTLVTELTATRWTGRVGYPLRAMVGMALAKSLYTLPTWTRTVGLVREHDALRTVLGCTDPADVPSVHACYRFTAKLRAHKPLLDACMDRVTTALHEQLPSLAPPSPSTPATCRPTPTGRSTSTKVVRSASGTLILTRVGPPERGEHSGVGKLLGYKLHQVVCAEFGLPLAWRVETAKAAESTFAVPLLASVQERGFRAEDEHPPGADRGVPGPPGRPPGHDPGQPRPGHEVPPEDATEPR